MKKTIIAAAIATVVAAPAMADVTIDGQVKVTIVDTDGSAGDYAPSFDNALNFKASEDLGNGMSAFAQISLDTDNGGTAATSGGSKDQKLGLKGGFGTIVAGRMETLTQGAVSSMMDDGGGNGNLESGITNLGRFNALAYVSPTVNGFHVAAAGTMNGAGTGNDDDGLFQHIDLVAAYDNGPLAVKLAHAAVDGADTAAVAAVAATTDAAAAAADATGLISQGSNGVATVAAATGEDVDITTFGASYSMGDAKISAMTTEADYDGATADVRDDIYRLDYKMGNNSILLGHRSAGAANSDVTAVKLTHKLSKRTLVWVGVRDKDAANSDQTHFGMLHKF